MKAALWYKAGDIRVTEVEEPVPEAGKVVIAVEWCGICGSDLHEYVSGPITIPVSEPHPLTGEVAPVILGHEFSGKVVGIGEGVTDIRIGDRVTVEPILYCGVCRECRRGMYNLCGKRGFHGITGNGGGFAEYTVVQAHMVHKIPDQMSFAEASVAEPAAVALHSIRNSTLKIGDTCAVFGVGPIGLLLIQAAKAAGASAIIAVEVSEKRLQKAGELGASYLINPCNGKVPEQILEVTNGQGADVCFEAAGAESALLDAIHSVKPGGEVVIVSLWENTVSFNPNLLVLKECKITCAVGYRYIFPEIISLIAGGQINANALITKRITLDHIVEEGFETLISDKSHCKIIVTPK